MPVSSSARYYASRFDYWIKQKGQAVALYRAGNPPVTVGTTTALLQFSEAARDAAMLAGIDPSQMCEAFFLSAATPNLYQRGYVKDADGAWWLIHSKPNAQKVENTVVGVTALLVRMVDAPVGV